MKASLMKVTEVDLENSYQPKVIFMKEVMIIIIKKEKVKNIQLQRKNTMKEVLVATKEMVKEGLSIKIEKYMKVNGSQEILIKIQNLLKDI